MFLPAFRSPSFRVLLIATVVAATMPFTGFGAPNSRAMREAPVADYPLTKVGVVMFKTAYDRIDACPRRLFAVHFGDVIPSRAALSAISA